MILLELVDLDLVPQRYLYGVIKLDLIEIIAYD